MGSETPVDELFKDLHNLAVKAYTNLTDEQYDEWCRRVKAAMEDEISCMGGRHVSRERQC